MAELGFGLMRLPLFDSSDKSTVDIETTRQMLRQYLASGFRYFDCGYFYHGGRSESIFGEYVASEYDRDAFIITSKLPVSHLYAQREYCEVFEEQLKRCRISYFDYYLLHGIGRKIYPKLQELNAFEVLAEQKRRGLTHKIGFSFHDHADVLEMILAEHPEIDTVQLQINFLDWQDCGVQAWKCYEICEKYNKEVLVMEPLKGGALVGLPPEFRASYESRAGASLVRDAFRFAASLKNVTYVLSGMSSIEQVRENTQVFAGLTPMNPDEKSCLLSFADQIRESMAFWCTACHYCVDACPHRIAIPDTLALYNNALLFGKKPAMKIIFSNLYEGSRSPALCVSCGKCEAICPQHLPVRELLKCTNDLFGYPNS